MRPKKILETLGIVDAESNKAYYEKLKKNGASDEDVEILSPDKIDNVELWKIATQIDNCSIVGGGFVPDNVDIDKINELNASLMLGMHLPQSIEMLEHYKIRKSILDIGSGYGALKKFVNHNWGYYGLDVYPRVDGTIPCDGVRIPLYLLQLVDLAVIFNVAQHWSDNQLDKILSQLSEFNVQYLLLSTINYSHYYSLMDRYIKHKDKEIYYTYTCGQLVPIRKHSDVIDILLKNNYLISYHSMRMDGMTLYRCYKYK